MEVRSERVVAAVPGRVMRALTEPVELTAWCCTDAEVGERFLLKGRSVPFGEVGGAVLVRTGEELTFRWPLAKAESVVSVKLEAVPQSGNPPADFTRVTVHHTEIPAGTLEARWEKDSWETFWMLWLRHLAGWVERADARGHFDFTGPFGRQVEQSLLVEAPAEKVWRAIVNPALRERWLTVPLGPELRREEGRFLVYAFSLDGPTTEVTFLLEPAGPAQTRVTVREEGLTWEGLDNHLGWLEFLVALHEAVAPPLIRQSILIDAPPAKVWRYVSSQEGLRRWFAENIRLECSVGAPVAFEEHGGALRGRVVAVEPERRLAFTWTELDAPGWSQDPAPLLLTIELVPERNGTRVTLCHSGFENLPEAIWSSQFASYQRGWASGTTLPGLKRHIEEGA